METLKQIIDGTTAKLVHICNNKVYYNIETKQHKYMLEINCNDEEWKDVYILPEYKSIFLMRWIRKGIANNDSTFLELI